MTKTPDRLRGYLSGYTEKYPGAWKLYETFRADRGKGLPIWPEWCWCPLTASYAIISGGGNNKVSIDRLPDIGALGALAAWRMTQGIYRFDSDVFAALWSTPLSGDLPVEVLYHLPEWCVYIEAPPGCKIDVFPLVGWFSHLEWDAETGRPELRFVFDFGQGLSPFMIHLTAPTLSGCIEKALSESWRRALEINTQSKAAEYLKKPSAETTEKMTDMLSTALTPIVSVVLYLCSVAADIADLRGKREGPGNPVPKKTKKGLRMFSATAETTWLVGHRIGASLRLATGSSSTGSGGAHASPRPHVRRAHWHSFWTGPKNDPEKRKPVLKWLPPVPVGAGEIVPTIRRVE